MAVKDVQHHVLACTCGDCLHWEIIHDGGVFSILCKTCGKEYPVKNFTLEPTVNLTFIERDAL